MSDKKWHSTYTNMWQLQLVLKKEDDKLSDEKYKSAFESVTPIFDNKVLKQNVAISMSYI